MCVCVCVFMCMCALTNTNTQTHVHRHTHIHRHTRTHKVTKTHMHSFTHTLGNWGNKYNTRSMQSSNIIKSSQTQTHTQTHTQTCLLRSGNNYNIDFICRANLRSSNFSQHCTLPIFRSLTYYLYSHICMHEYTFSICGCTYW